ncbi:hypothetical protein BY458DRAFT_505345 [Sporodiniella umbellata]|nr:hypothetical protein BY458DRAFT_505345 [Sporodiniella umbellata]
MEEVKKPSKPQKMPTQSRATTQKKLVTKQASSDSDSDSTDMEEVKKLPKPTQARAATQKKPITRQASSESDSDSTDVEKEKKLPESQKRPTKSRPTTSKKHASQQTSSESDDSDREAVKKQFLSKKFISESDSDSDDTDKEKNQKKTTTQTAKGKDDKAESDSDSNSDEDGTFVYRKQKRLNLERNRISNRKTCAYDENRSAAWNYKNKASDAFVPTVYEDFFISDSESDTDSGDDYNSDSFPVWQQSLRGKKEGETNWPKRKKFGYSDNLKLEKRVKKICRRENISFQEVQEIFASERPTTHKKFYQKIARVFPNVPIKSIVAHCRDSYHPNRNNKEWTKEDVSRLNQLVEFHGRNARLIAKDMNRMTSDVQTYMSKHLKDDKKKNNKSRWTKEEDEVLAKGITELKAKNGESFQIASLERLFNGEKSRFQLQNRYKRIKHLIQPDGSLLSNRKANVLEELEFLERLKEQVVEEKLVEESQLNFSKYCGFAKPTFYYQRRATIPGFEKMKVIDILNTLIKKQKIIVDSRRSEGLL